jgi:hypothetical protein
LNFGAPRVERIPKISIAIRKERNPEKCHRFEYGYR